MSTEIELHAGGEMDAEVARRVFGFWKARHPDGLMNGDEYWWAPHHTMPGAWMYVSAALRGVWGSSFDYADGLPKFSRDIAAAWTVIETMVGRTINDLVVVNADVSMSRYAPDEPDGYTCLLSLATALDADLSEPITFQGVDASAETAPLAICRAALKAVSAA
jgi:hypothetical protein